LTASLFTSEFTSPPAFQQCLMETGVIDNDEGQ